MILRVLDEHLAAVWLNDILPRDRLRWVVVREVRVRLRLRLLHVRVLQVLLRVHRGRAEVDDLSAGRERDAHEWRRTDVRSVHGLVRFTPAHCRSENSVDMLHRRHSRGGHGR